MGNTYESLEIVAAQQGGYIVFPADRGRGYERAALYAGELGACLDFIRENIIGPGEARKPDVVMAA